MIKAIFIHIQVSIYPSIHPSIHPSIYQSICLSSRLFWQFVGAGVALREQREREVLAQANYTRVVADLILP